MLNGIKNRINQKQEFLEAAQIIFEDATDNIDDLIFLGEEADDDIPDNEKNANLDDESGNDDTGDGEGEKEPEDSPTGSEDLNDEEGDILHSSIGNEEEPSLPLPGDEDLPAAMKDQSEEPLVDNIDDFLNVSINLGSNTINDILPVPPGNAEEAIGGDDILNSRIDDGFGEEEESTDIPTNIEEPVEDDILKESIYSEAITLGGDASQVEPIDGGEVPTDGTIPDAGGEQPASGESEVTAAVKDKVAEVETPTDGAGGVNGKEELLKKLGSITKSLEDAKNAVMKSIQ